MSGALMIIEVLGVLKSTTSFAHAFRLLPFGSLHTGKKENSILINLCSDHCP